MRKLIAFLLFIGTCPSYGFVECYKPLSKGYLAAQKYSPYETMFWTSQVTSLGVAISLPQNDDESQKMLIANAFGGILWGVGTAAALITPPCPPSKTIYNDEDLLVSDIDPKVYQGEEVFFYLFHGINTTVLLIDASYSTRKDKYAYVAGAFVSPFVVDVLNRYLFSKHKLSPYSGPKIQSVQLVPLENQISLNFSASF